MNRNRNRSARPPYSMYIFPEAPSVVYVTDFPLLLLSFLIFIDSPLFFIKYAYVRRNNSFLRVEPSPVPPVPSHLVPE